MNEPTAIPGEVGVIVLPGVALPPGALLPLSIFEPRYREMLERALETERVFAVGTHAVGGGADDAEPIGGLGVIRACVRRDDGTSHLVLEGLAWVRFVAWTQLTPYRVARLERLEA